MARSMGEALGGGFGGTFFGSFVNDDSKNPDYYVLYMGQSGLGLSDRELYLQEKFAPQKTRYQQYVAQLLGMAGWPNAEAGRGQGGRAGNPDRRRALDPGREPQPRQDLQSDHAGRAAEVRARLQLGDVRECRRDRQGREDRGVAEHRFPQTRADLRRRGPRDAEGLAGLSTPWTTPPRFSPSASSTRISSSGRSS
jgi:hypothetical protein